MKIFVIVCSMLCALSAFGKDSEQPWTDTQLCVHEVEGTTGDSRSIPQRFQFKSPDAKKLCVGVQSGASRCFAQLSYVNAVPSDAQKKQLVSLCVHAQPETGPCVQEGADSATFTRNTFQNMDTVVQAFQSCASAPPGFEKCYTKKINEDPDMKGAWDKLCPVGDVRVECLSGEYTSAIAAENGSVPEVPKKIYKSCRSNPNLPDTPAPSGTKSTDGSGHTN